MKIDYIRVCELRPYPNNARTHSKKQVRLIANSIGKFGFCNPVLIDDDKQIIAGHGRVEAAKLLGIDAVPTCRLSHLSEADRRAYILADNKLAEKAGWDKQLLSLELQYLIDLDVDIEFDRVRDAGNRHHPGGCPRGSRRIERLGRCRASALIRSRGQPDRRPLVAGQSSPAVRRCPRRGCL